MELRGEHLVLTSVGFESSEVVLPAFNGDEQFNVWSGLSEHVSLEEVQREIQEIQQLPEGNAWRIDALLREHEQATTLVGVAETAIHPNPETGWIALLIIGKPFQRRGYGTEAASLLEKYLYSHATVKRIGLGVIVQNTHAQKFWERQGYVHGRRTHDLQGHDCYEYYRYAYL